MTTVPAQAAPVAKAARRGPSRDHRGSPIPSGAMIATRFMELRRRRGLMIALIVVNIGIPTIFLVVRLLVHAFDPKSYGPAGGYSIYTGLVAGVMYVFGFIVAAALGCTAGSVDLTEGMFRHLVVTGRSRLAIYLARIPAGLAIILSLVAIGFTIVCLVCVFAAPTTLNYNGTTVPAGLSRSAFENWAGDHPKLVICNFGFRIEGKQPSTPVPAVLNSVPCGPNGPIVSAPPGSNPPGHATPAQIRAVALLIARQNYPSYSTQFLTPPISLMVKSGLWLELEATIGFIVGLGLGSLLGQRTISVILMIVLEIVLTPIFSRARIPHLLNLQRAVVGVATAHLAPGGISVFGGGGGPPGSSNGNPGLIPESTRVAVFVIVAWLVVWTALGAWRMMTRDA
jgi:hypothetical protein